jgi:hypothetical protein
LKGLQGLSSRGCFPGLAIWDLQFYWVVLKIQIQRKAVCR